MENPPEILWSDEEIQRQEKLGPRINHPKSGGLYDDVKLGINILGEEFLKKFIITADSTKSKYIFNGRHWQEVNDEYLRSKAMTVDNQKYTSTSRRKQTVDYAVDRSLQYLINWNQLEKDEIAFEDGIIKLVEKTEKNKEGYIRKDHDWEYYLDSVIPHRYKHWEKCPTWLKCLDQWFESEDKKLALQEFFGYVLCSHVKFKKALLLLGESNAGKSVPCDILKEIIGSYYTCSINLDLMDDPNALADIKGKKLNLITELSADSNIADGGFKKLVSGESIQINKKFIARHTIEPIAKHVIATNNLPRIRDESLGVYNRLLIIRFNRVVPKEQQDPELLDKLKKEILGIVAWSVEGLRRLILNKGQFTEIEESKNILLEYRMSQNPLLSFVEESGIVEKDPSSKIEVNLFRRKFQEYKGGKEFNKTTIGRKMKQMGFESTPSNGKRYYKGLKLKETSDEKRKEIMEELPDF